jgi:large subunit ribosomal protein L6
VVENNVLLSRPTESKNHKSLHGLYRALIANMVEGVSNGYKKELELVGVGYRAEAKGQSLELSLGYSHDIVLLLPDEVKVETKTERRSNPIITLTCIGHLNLTKEKVLSLSANNSEGRLENQLVFNLVKEKKSWP